MFTSPLHAPDSRSANFSKEDRELLREIHEHLTTHGDAVRDVGFEVDDVESLYMAAVSKGAKAVSPPKTLSDENGSVKVATIQTYGDTSKNLSMGPLNRTDSLLAHTLIERHSYRGPFLPGFRQISETDPTSRYLPEVRLEVVDHCVGNQDWDEMENACD